MSIGTLLLMTALIGAPVVCANTAVENNTQKLQALIDQADATKFKALADQLMNNQNTSVTLLEYAQEKRGVLQKKYAGLSGSSKNYKALAKGVGQYYLGLCSGLGAILATSFYANLVIKKKLNLSYDKWQQKIIDTLIYSIAAIPALFVSAPVGQYRYNKDFTGNELNATAAYIIPTLLACAGAKYLTRYGAQNIKQGWDYKTYLETQIKNLDEIIAYLQNPNVASVTEEQV